MGKPTPLNSSKPKKGWITVRLVLPIANVVYIVDGQAYSIVPEPISLLQLSERANRAPAINCYNTTVKG